MTRMRRTVELGADFWNDSCAVPELAAHRSFEDFRKAYDEDGMKPHEFVHYGATVHTLNQFISGYQDRLGFVRERMLR